MKNNEEIKKEGRVLIRNLSPDGGIGELFIGNKRYASVIWSIGAGWDHVSISPFNKRAIPTWDEMCRLKDIFFHEEETVVQYHPPKSDYVNNLPNCLHLWRPQIEKMPRPPAILVGIKQDQSYDEIKKAIKEVSDGV